eukprot:CAMPEP_0174929724 /NCGR_PEP_ID=MMETSP1355-20121228/28423_1 /TAXON_ID=464990 /ORGANISM="Hemiselmis tepida, Strain CCMP443" /LENGTH=356 /DNA_ID=CAMNT_0016175953 /DNA_START=45 /DNA_END=1112 /DNA_ORIENTATION=+
MSHEEEAAGLHPPPVFEFAAEGHQAPVSSLRARRAKKFEQREARNIPSLASDINGSFGGASCGECCADAEGDAISRGDVCSNRRSSLGAEVLPTPPTVKSHEHRPTQNPLQRMYERSHATKFAQSDPVLHPVFRAPSAGSSGSSADEQPPPQPPALRRANRPHVPLSVEAAESLERSRRSEDWREPDVCTPIQRTRSLTTTQRPKLAVSPDFDGLPARKVSKRWSEGPESGSLMWFMSRRGEGMSGRREDEDEEVNECNELLREIRLPGSEDERMRFAESPSLGKRDRHGCFFELPPSWALAAAHRVEERSSSPTVPAAAALAGGGGSLGNLLRPGNGMWGPVGAAASHGLYSAEG